MQTQHLQGVIFDWAGTLVDHGSLAPTQIFVDAFAEFGIRVSLQQAAGPMGLSKRDHIRTLLAEPDVQASWQQRFGRPSTEADIDAIYETFMPMQIEKVRAYATPIPGAVEVIAALRARGLKLGSCSGYPQQVMDVLLPLAKAEGIEMDHVVAGDELPAGGRPASYMALANMLALGLPDVRCCVKVDDTEPGIREGRNAGMWTVGLALSGAPAGLTLAQLQALPASAVSAIRERVTQAHLAAGAHFVIDSVADLLPLIDQIERLLANGERP